MDVPKPSCSSREEYYYGEENGTKSSYYGHLDLEEKPIRPISEDIAKDVEDTLFTNMRGMEDRLKRHITECKREVIKELYSFFKPKPTEENKEIVHGSKPTGKGRRPS